MLLFKEYHIDPILTGRKFQTRRIWKRPKVKVGSIHLCKTKMLSKEWFAKVCIIRVRHERLGNITPGGAYAEGGYTVEQFIELWKEINGAWNPDQMVYVVNFCVIETPHERAQA